MAASAAPALIAPVTATVRFQDMGVMGKRGAPAGCPESKTPVHSSNGKSDVRRRRYCLERMARLISGAIAANASCKLGALA